MADNFHFFAHARHALAHGRTTFGSLLDAPCRRIAVLRRNKKEMRVKSKHFARLVAILGVRYPGEGKSPCPRP